MDSNIIARKWIQGMTVKPDSLLGQAFTGEEGAHTFRITGETTGGAAAPITGTIAAKFLRSDNITVPLSGSVSDGVAVVTLTDECYLVPGRFIFSIYVIQGDLRMCIYCGVGNVFRTDSGEYEGGQIITDITELINEIQAAVESIPPDYSELTGEVADLKSQMLLETNKAVDAGEDAVYNGWLKNTGSSDTVWFTHLIPNPANEGHLYAIVYGTDNIRDDVKYYVRITANYTDGTALEAARITALNKPFFLFTDARKSVADYSVVCNRYDTSSSGSLTATSSWGILVYSDRLKEADNTLRTLNDKNIIFSVAGYAGRQTDTTKWLDYFITASVTDFWIRIDEAAERIGTPSHLARVVCYYTGNTNQATFIDTIGEPVHVVADPTKTVDHWSIVLYVAASNAYTATKWRIIAWQEPQEPFLQRLAGLLEEPDVLKIEGAAYGPVSRDYKAVTTSENWQSASYATLNGIPGGGYKYVYAMMFGRHGIGKRAGAVQFFDSNGDSIKALPLTAVEAVPGYPIMQAFEIPDGTVTLNVSFEGISNASAAGQASVVGEVYYVHDCYVFLTDTPILNSCRNWLDSEWSAAVDTIRAAQGTAFTFGIQTDTHFAPGYPLYVGKQLNQFAKLVGLDFIANLGDITRGYSGSNYPDSPENMRLAAKTIMSRYTDGLPCPFFVTIGNHEKSTLYADDHTGADPFSQDELYAMFTKQSVNTSARIVAEPGKSYYYADLNGFRVICLFTNDSEPFAYKVSADQIAWFTTKALDTTLPVLVLAHVPMIPNVSQSGVYSDTYGTIITALEAFKTNGGTVIACIYGHTHSQSAQKVNGIWHICCTWTETQFTTAEIFMVDTATYNITTLGIGKAESRTFEH